MKSFTGVIIYFLISFIMLSTGCDDTLDEINGEPQYGACVKNLVRDKLCYDDFTEADCAQEKSSTFYSGQRCEADLWFSSSDKSSPDEGICYSDGS